MSFAGIVYILFWSGESQKESQHAGSKVQEMNFKSKTVLHVVYTYRVRKSLHPDICTYIIWWCEERSCGCGTEICHIAGICWWMISSWCWADALSNSSSVCLYHVYGNGTYNDEPSGKTRNSGRIKSHIRILDYVYVQNTRH